MTNNFMAAQNSFDTPDFGRNNSVANMSLLGTTMNVPDELRTTNKEFLDKITEASLDYTYLRCLILVAAYIQVLGHPG